MYRHFGWTVNSGLALTNSKVKVYVHTYVRYSTTRGVSAITYKYVHEVQWAMVKVQNSHKAGSTDGGSDVTATAGVTLS